MAGLGDLSKIMKEAQQLQKKMAEKQEEIASREVTASSGGGMVTVVATGDMAIKSIQIDKEVVDPEDTEMLQDLILAAVNEAINRAKEMAKDEMSGLAGGLNIPGLM